MSDVLKGNKLLKAIEDNDTADFGEVLDILGKMFVIRDRLVPQGSEATRDEIIAILQIYIEDLSDQAQDEAKE